MSANNLATKLEAALFAVVATVQSQISTVLIKRGVDGTEVALPCVIVECSGGEPDPQLGHLGIWRMRANVTVRTSPDEYGATSATHATRVGIVLDAIITDGIEADLSASASDFRVFGDGAVHDPGVILEGQAQEILDRGWGSVLTLSVVCCGSDVT